MLKQLYYKIRWFPENVYNGLIMKIRKVEHGRNLKILGSIFVRGKGKIVLGNDVTINSCLEANPIGGGVKNYFLY